jgi:hypothetical protein
MEVHSEGHHEQQEKEECVICLDDVETEWRELECHHHYHKQCIEDWIAISAKCPMCMKSIKDNKVDERNIIDEIHYIAIRRFMIFMLCMVSVIIVMVLCSS